MGLVVWRRMPRCENCGHLQSTCNAVPCDRIPPTTPGIIQAFRELTRAPLYDDDFYEWYLCDLICDIHGELKVNCCG